MIIYPYFLILKKAIDGYSLKGGRSIQLATLSNCSIWAAENSTDATDVHYMADVNEDAYSRMVVDQMSDKEIWLTKILGVVDVASGAMIGVVATQAEDSKSKQFAFGRGSATSKSRLIMTRFSWAHLCAKWLTVFSPISFGSYGAHCRWTNFLNTRLRPKCAEDFPNVIPELVPFAKSMLCPHIGTLRKEYMRAHKWMKDNIQLANLQYSDWSCAESVRVKAVEPLHCTLRIPITCLKWYFLYTLQYCEWIGDEANAEFRRINHGCGHEDEEKEHEDGDDGTEQYHVCTVDEILHHFKYCLGIPLSYDKECPSRSSIAANGAWRRQLWNHLEDAVVCSKCNFRPWANSEIERYWMLLFVNLIEIMVPLEILDHRFYHEYWERYLKYKFIKSGANDLVYDSANVWSIYAQHFFTLFMKLLGPNRMTRYVHGMVFCTMHGFEVAHALKSTYRAIFGSDIVETMNSVTKTTTHRSSSRFAGHKRDEMNQALSTFEQIMKRLLWNRYEFRALSERMNLHFRLKKILQYNQRRRDAHNMNMANRMRQRCQEMGFSLRIDCPLSNEYQKIGTFARMKLHPTHIHFYATAQIREARAISNPEDDQLRQNLASMLNVVDAVQDTAEVNEQKAQFEDWSNHDDDEYDFDESTLIRRFYRVQVVATATTLPPPQGVAQTAAPKTSPRTTSMFVTELSHDTRIAWSPLQLIYKKSDWNFGANWIRLTTRIKEVIPGTTSKRIISYRLTWRYHDLRFITYVVQRHHVGILMKFCTAPVYERKSESLWTVATATPTTFAPFGNVGKVSLWVERSDVNIGNIENLVEKWKYFTVSHQIEQVDFAGVAAGYSQTECADALNAFRASKCPVLRSHPALCREIDAIFKAHRCGGKRACLACNQPHGVFERHVICMADGNETEGVEEAHNVTRHIFERLLYTDHFDESAAIVRVVADPLQSSVRSRACRQIQKDPEFWGTVVFNVYVSFASYLQRHKLRRLLQCSKDEDYQSLCCSVRTLIYMLNESMSVALREKSRTRRQIGSTQSAVKALITVVSDMFVMPKMFEENIGNRALASAMRVDDRLEMWDSPYFTVRLKNHYRKRNVCRDSALIFIIYTYAAEIVGDPNVWTFMRFVEAE